MMKRIFGGGKSKRSYGSETSSLMSLLEDDDAKYELQVDVPAADPTEAAPLEEVETTPATSVAPTEAETSPVPTFTTTTRASTTTTIDPGDTYEAQEESEKEEALKRAWRKNRQPKLLPIPTEYPDYMKEPPELSYAETETSLLRRSFNRRKIRMSQDRPFKRNEGRIKPGKPHKTNRANTLKLAYLKREVIYSPYFEKHFERYEKPPFKNVVKKCVQVY